MWDEWKRQDYDSQRYQTKKREIIRQKKERKKRNRAWLISHKKALHHQHNLGLFCNIP